jgi:hypothetical protein
MGGFCRKTGTSKKVLFGEKGREEPAWRTGIILKLVFKNGVGADLIHLAQNRDY